MIVSSRINHYAGNFDNQSIQPLEKQDRPILFYMLLLMKDPLMNIMMFY